MDDPATEDDTPIEITDEMIGERAHQISQSEHRGSPQDDWFRAAQELRSEAHDKEPSSETTSS